MRALTIIVIATIAVTSWAEEHIAVSTGQHYYDNPAVGRPFGTDAQRFQILVMEKEIQGKRGDEILGMAFHCALASTNPATFTNVEILVCPTSKDKLDTSFDANYEGHEPRRVFSKDKMTVDWMRTGPPAEKSGRGALLSRRGGGEWQRISFDTPYEYTGTGNLIVEIRHDGGDGTVQTTRWRSDAGRVLDSVGRMSTGRSASTGFHREYLNGLRLYIERVEDGQE